LLLPLQPNRYVIFGIVLILSSILYLLSGRFTTDYSIDAKAHFVNQVEFSIIRLSDGNINHSLRDNLTGLYSKIYKTEFQRGDVVEFVVNEKILSKNKVQQGDTLGWITSNETERNLLELNGQFEILSAELDFFTTGQKPEDVELAGRRVELAKEQLDIQRKLTERSRILFTDSVIPVQEYEIELNRLNVREIELKVAEANYKSITTGEKPEQEGIVRAQMRNIRNQIKQIDSRLSLLTITSPIGGKLQVHQGVDTSNVILTVYDTSKYVSRIPVLVQELPYLNKSCIVKAKAVEGSIYYISEEVSYIGYEQVCYITGAWPYSRNIRRGAIQEVEIICDRITLRDYLARRFFAANIR
jgi:hypothetical protein